jgi:1-acyl-sn-glycerol-3-phosphate acyltransferase
MVLSRKVRRENRSLRWRTWVITQWTRYMLRTAGRGPFMSKARVVGDKNIPARGGVIVVFWHPTIRDPHNIFKVFPRNLAFMAAEFLFRGPKGRLLKMLGHIEVRRGTIEAAEAREEAIRIVRDGGAVALAPESGCTPEGELVGPFKTGAARIALATGAPVHLALPFGTTTRRYDGLRGLISKPPVTIVFTEQILPISEFAYEGAEDETVVEAYTAYLHVVTRVLAAEGAERLTGRYAAGQSLVRVGV